MRITRQMLLAGFVHLFVIGSVTVICKLTDANAGIFLIGLIVGSLPGGYLVARSVENRAPSVENR